MKVPSRIMATVSAVVTIAAIAYAAIAVVAAFAKVPVPIFPVLLPAIIAWSLQSVFEGERLPKVGPPSWLRRWIFFTVRELRAHRTALALLTLLMFAMMVAVGVGRLHINYVLSNALMSTASQLVHVFINYMAVFYLLSHVERARRWALLLAAVDVVGYWAIEPLVWGALKVALLAGVNALAEARAERALPVAGPAALLGEMGSWPWISEESRATPIRRLLPMSWWVVLPPLALFVAVLFNPMSARPPKLTWFGVADALLAWCLGNLLIMLWRAAGLLIRLKNNDVLSQLLLTELRRRHILGGILRATVEPYLLLSLVAPLFLLFMQYAIFEGMLFEDNLGAARLIMYSFPAQYFIGLVLIGPAIHHALHSDFAIACVFKSLRGCVLVTAAILAGVLAILMVTPSGSLSVFSSSRRGDFDDLLELLIYSAPILLPALVVWSYIKWQHLLRDFDEVAHGNKKQRPAVASRAEVEEFRRTLRGIAVSPPAQEPAPAS